MHQAFCLMHEVYHRVGAICPQCKKEDEDFRKPPCGECGAMTLEEAETKCICSGDKDDCHGTSIWPD